MPKKRCYKNKIRTPVLYTGDCLFCGKYFEKSVTCGPMKGTYCGRSCATKDLQRKRFPNQPIIKLCEKNISIVKQSISLLKRTITLSRVSICRVCSTPYRAKQGQRVCSVGCRKPIDVNKRRAYISKARKDGIVPRGRSRERAKHYGVEYKYVPPKKILDRDNWTCYVCKDVLSKDDRGKNLIKSPEIDHIIPISLGGPHIESNLACICRACNIKKSNKM